MEDKKKIWEKKWFAFLIVFVVAPLAIFFVISLLVKEPKEVADSSPKKEAVATMANDGEKSDHSEKKTDLKSKRAISSDGVKVSSFVAEVKKSKPVVKEEPKADEPTPESTSDHEPTPDTEPVVESEPSSADKQIAAEIDDYVNVFWKYTQREGKLIQQEQVELMAGGTLTEENAKKIRTHLVPRMQRLSDTVTKKQVTGSELREFHKIVVEGEKMKSASILKYVKAFETRDTSLAQEANAEISNLTASYNAYYTGVVDLAAKYGVTVR